MPPLIDLSVRQATDRDYDAVARLNAEVQELHVDALPRFFKPVGRGTFPRARFEDLLTRERCHVLVAETSEPVGYLLAELVEAPDTATRYAQRVLRIHELSVAANNRRCGCGRALLKHATSLAKSNGVTRVDLDAWWFNENARAFFKSAGFRELSVRFASDCA